MLADDADDPIIDPLALQPQPPASQDDEPEDPPPAQFADAPLISTDADIDHLLRLATEQQRRLIHRIWPTIEQLGRKIAALHVASPGAASASILTTLLKTAAHPRHQDAFATFLLSEPRVQGRVLDIGCGAALPTWLADLHHVCHQLDGVDPDPSIAGHPALKERWNASFEEAPIPAATYDLAYAHFTNEYVPDARKFFEKLRTILKPGGVFWAITYNRRHLYCRLAAARQFISAGRVRSGCYHLNTDSQIHRAIQGLNFAASDFHYFPAGEWHRAAIPPALGWLVHLYDFTIGRRFTSHHLIMTYRLEKEAQSLSPAGSLSSPNRTARQ